MVAIPWKSRVISSQSLALLDKFGVPEAEQQELFATIGSTKGDIVVAE